MAKFMEFNSRADGPVILNADRIMLVQEGSADPWGEGMTVIGSDDDGLSDGERVSNSYDQVRVILLHIPGARFLEVAETVGHPMLINANYIIRACRGVRGRTSVVMGDRGSEDLELELAEEYGHFRARLLLSA